jgi:hypothetical protein
MKFKLSSVCRFAAVLVFTFSLFASYALAGPPLICHTFDIGNAKSLPWISHDWNLSGSESYDTKNLSADTIAILDADSTVLVHMETLRRATLYGQKDPVAAKQLLIKLIARSDAAGKNASAAALATFDVGYFAEALGEAQWLYKSSGNPAQGLDGYSLVKKALQVRGNDPQMEFAASLMTLDRNGPASEHQDHTQKALAGAKSDPLLARNFAIHFIGPQSQTMTDLLSRTSSVKVAQQ